MINIDIPGFGPVSIQHVVLDFNGTIAEDGCLLPGLGKAMASLAGQVEFHVLTADTFGSVKKELEGINCTLKVISEKAQDKKKQDYVSSLGAEKTLAAGNGANDARMLKTAKIGVGVMLKEGMAVAAMTAADIVVRDILDLFGLLSVPNRLIAGLRT
ncbi:HAD family hydrolase [Desulfocicer niacini]